MLGSEPHLHIIMIRRAAIPYAVETSIVLYRCCCCVLLQVQYKDSPSCISIVHYWEVAWALSSFEPPPSHACADQKSYFCFPLEINVARLHTQRCDHCANQKHQDRSSWPTSLPTSLPSCILTVCWPSAVHCEVCLPARPPARSPLVT